MKLQLDQLPPYHELPGWTADSGLIGLVKTYFDTQRTVAEPLRRSTFKPDPETARRTVSEEALRAHLAANTDVHGIATDREISNVIVFNAGAVPDSLPHERITQLRRDVDAGVRQKLAETFDSRLGFTIIASGHFWYPPGAYMGWHTNSRAPGWRLYLSHAETERRSFLRYRDPDSGEVVTAWDGPWNARLFRIRKEKPLWHAVWSDTNRFSLGYVVQPATVRSKLRRLLQREPARARD